MEKRTWTVLLKKKLARHIEVEFSDKIREKISALFEDLEKNGPVLPHWPHYGKLRGKEMYHCHIKSGRPTYVVCWIADKKEKKIEVTYAGTHEKAPY